MFSKSLLPLLFLLCLLMSHACSSGIAVKARGDMGIGVSTGSRH